MTQLTSIGVLLAFAAFTLFGDLRLATQTPTQATLWVIVFVCIVLNQVAAFWPKARISSKKASKADEA